MRRPGRCLAATLLFAVLVVSGFCLDVPRRVEVLTGQPFGEQFGKLINGESKYTFLTGLLSYLEGVKVLETERFEIEITGTLPSIAREGELDFCLTGPVNDRYGILYRYGTSASYKRASVSVRRIKPVVEIKTEIKSDLSAGIATKYRITKGQAVKVTLVSGLVRLEMDGEAMQSGTGSDRIKIKVRETGKEFIGTITGPMEVDVVL